jgi:hypothetical protein
VTPQLIQQANGYRDLRFDSKSWNDISNLGRGKKANILMNSPNVIPAMVWYHEPTNYDSILRLPTTNRELNA